MEFSSLNTKTHNHARSNSLPSKPHPIILQCNEHLSKLGGANSNFDAISSLTLTHKLNILQDLHICIEKLVQLPLTQEALVKQSQEKWVDEFLESSLRLLDTCTATKDALLHTKECARELQSFIRRKRGGELEVTIEVKKFLTSRKVVRKAIFKALENLKGNTHKCILSINNNSKDYQTLATISLLKEVEMVTFDIFESLLSVMCGTQTKRSSWSLVSKVLSSKRVSNSLSQGEDENEFAKVDNALELFAFNIGSKLSDVENLQNKLVNLGSCIQDFEEGLESLFRRLIKIRVALLNILNH